jgi:hypothetical protein
MKTKNKMKDFDVEAFFFKELEKNLAHHRINEKTYKHKLEVYQRTFPNFVCGSPINIKTSNENEDKVGPNGTVEEEVQVKEPWILYMKIKNHK